jgi:hypothetical protein
MEKCEAFITSRVIDERRQKGLAPAVRRAGGYVYLSSAASKVSAPPPFRNKRLSEPYVPKFSLSASPGQARTVLCATHRAKAERAGFVLVAVEDCRSWQALRLGM